MTVLALDTATDGAAVALWTPAGTRVRALPWRASFTATVPAAAALLGEAGRTWADVTDLAVPAGPGSFTGLRVGAALALGLAEGRGVGLHAVPTLAAVAEAFAPPGAARVCAWLDARRGRRYAAVYERDGEGWRREAGPVDVPPADLEGFADGAPLVGPPGEDGRPRPVAGALAELVRRDPAGHRLSDPGALALVYARPGVDR